MNTDRARQYHLTIRVCFLIVLLVSCTNQSPSAKSSKELKVFVDDKKIEVEQDSSLRLNYPSGIRSIFEDSKGNFWFGSHQEGVCMFDGKNLIYFTEEDGLSNNQIRTIQEDRNGRIWFGTGRGVTSYNGRKFIDHSLKNNLLFNHPIVNQWQKKPDDLWFHGDDKPGVFRYDASSNDSGNGGQDLIYLGFPLPEHEDGDPFVNLVTGIDKGEFGKIWFATYTGVIGYDGISFSYINDETLGLTEENNRLHIRSILEDKKGNVWIGNNGIGVLLYDGKTTINFSEQNGVSIKDKGMNGSLGRIFSIAEDSKGNIWFGTRDNGAWKYDGKELINYTIEDGLSSVFVNEIYMDKSNELWFGLGDGGVFKFNGKSFYRMY